MFFLFTREGPWREWREPSAYEGYVEAQAAFLDAMASSYAVKLVWEA